MILKTLKNPMILRSYSIEKNHLSYYFYLHQIYFLLLLAILQHFLVLIVLFYFP